MTSEGSLDGRVALVTGGASGIGFAIARVFSEAGAIVAIIDLDQTGLEAAVEAIQRAGGQAVGYPGDVTDSGKMGAVIADIQQTFGQVDVLVNNAGIIQRTTLLETTEAAWDRMMAVNLKSVFLLSKLVIPPMAAAGGGVIINIASGWGLVGGRQAAAYCASKAGVVNLTRAMALDHGPQNIRVNCLCPGDTDTPLLQREAEDLGIAKDVFLAQSADRPLQRLGQPLDVARAARFLAGDEAAYITGATLVVDGGGLAG